MCFDVSGFAFFQMIFSLIFFVVHRIRRLIEVSQLMQYVCCRCRSRASFYRNMRGLPDAAPAPAASKSQAKLKINAQAAPVASARAVATPVVVLQ